MNQEMNELLQIETQIVEVLKEVYDPEIPVNVYDLGLIYNIEVGSDNDVVVTMTLTAPNCPIADEILIQVKEAVESIKEVKSVRVDLVFDPPWSMDSMTEEAKLELGML
ncbi:Fe-S assembly SUF system protein [Bacteroidia bacterium]|nr:Fe-S assembly SUF system protein [Bacteroidia bacterium]